MFLLPFTEPAAAVVTLDVRGAKFVAKLCCEMAAKNHSLIECESEYAWQMAAFMAGHMAAATPSEHKKMFIFNEFLQQVEDWLESAYPTGDPDEPYLPSAFAEDAQPGPPLRTRI